jgi:hypothetical protein
MPGLGHFGVIVAGEREHLERDIYRERKNRGDIDIDWM